MTIKVGIIEDENQIRQSLSMIIDGSEGFSCRHIYENAEDAILAIPHSDLDIVLTDLHLPGKTGIECIKELKPICPSVNFLIFTSFEDTDNIFNALKVGAIGYLVKTIQPSKLLDAIVEAYKGGSPMSSQIARKVVQSFNGINENIELEKLSNREREILDLLSKGLRYKEIADKLFLSTETVRTHIRNTYEKLQVNSRTEALNKIYKN
jgi:DNA-binding NarL/FixJ family response regulator